MSTYSVFHKGEIVLLYLLKFLSHYKFPKTDHHLEFVVLRLSLYLSEVDYDSCEATLSTEGANHDIMKCKIQEAL